MLNARDIAALNRAREVLKRLEDAALDRALGEHDPYAPVAGWDLGRLSEAATAADDAIFHVLWTARTYCGVKITDAQLAGRAAANQPTARAAIRPTPPIPPMPKLVCRNRSRTPARHTSRGIFERPVGRPGATSETRQL